MNRALDVGQVLGVGRENARDLLKAWVEDEWLARDGERRGIKYLPGRGCRYERASRHSHDS